MSTVLDLDAFLDVPEAEYDDVIPGTLERGERVILTAGEGVGKSTLFRQIAVQVASGINPWTANDMPAQRTLLLDLENSERHVRRKLRTLRIAAGNNYHPRMLAVVVRPQGLDVLRHDDAAWLRGLVDHVQPALLVTGPIYKMVAGEAEKEQPARALTAVLDELRVRHRMAVLLEAHQPYAATGQRRRPLRPYGSSVYSRWPEFGIALDEDGRLEHCAVSARKAEDGPGNCAAAVPGRSPSTSPPGRLRRRCGPRRAACWRSSPRPTRRCASTRSRSER